MRHRISLAALALLLAACSVQEREVKAPAAAMRTSGGGFSEAVPVRRGSVASRPSKPYLEGNLVQKDDDAIAVPEGTPYLPENPEVTKLCASQPMTDESGTATFPVKDRYAHLPVTGQFFTAWSCGLRRVRELPAVHGDDYAAPVHFTLAAEPGEDFKGALIMAGFVCEKQTKGKGCIEWTMAEDVRVDLLARVGKFADQIVKE